MVTTDEIRALTHDPALAAALAVGDDVLAAARLSELLTETAPIPVARLLAFAAQTGFRARLEDAAEDAAHPLRSLALAALDLLRGGVSETFDAVVYGGMLDVLVVGGLMSAAERAQITALATRPRTVTPDEVAAAVRHGDGTSKL